MFFLMQKGETFATFYLGYLTLIQSSFDVDDAFTWVPHFFLAKKSYDTKLSYRF